MKPQEQLFLEALKASLTNTTVTWTNPLSTEEWQSLFALAESHKVLPLIFHAVYSCPSAAGMDKQLFVSTKRRTLTLTLNQVYLKLVDGEFIPHISKKDNEKRGVLAVALLPNVDGTFD